MLFGYSLVTFFVCYKVRQDRKKTHRLFVPFLGEVKVVSMDDEEDIDNDKEMVRVPKGIEACESLDGFWEVQAVAAEPWLSQGECYDH